jgi:hypothetical protein
MEELKAVKELLEMKQRDLEQEKKGLDLSVNGLTKMQILLSKVFKGEYQEPPRGYIA